MDSSLEDTMLLLNKWKAESSLIRAEFSDASHANFRANFILRFDGVVRAVSPMMLELSGERFRFRLRLTGASFKYVEAYDPVLTDLDLEDRRRADEAFEGCLLIDRDGKLCSLCVMRRS
jgi:hypothetical protein